jgi:hypothetical protein
MDDSLGNPYLRSLCIEDKNGSRGLGIHFNGKDLRAIFYDGLACPKYDVHNSEASLAKFKQHLTEYPMLFRIIEWRYVGHRYDYEEVKRLRDECLKLHSLTTHPDVLKGLRKLELACDEVLPNRAGMLMACA